MTTAFLLEDGTGLADSNSYGGVQAFKDYCDLRGYDRSGAAADSDVETALVAGTDYIDRRWEPRMLGMRLLESQALAFPREWVRTKRGTAYEVGVPKNLEYVCYEYALRAITDALMPDPTVDDSGAMVVQSTKTVGPISKSTTFLPGSIRVTRDYPNADKLLSYLLRPAGVIR